MTSSNRIFNLLPRKILKHIIGYLDSPDILVLVGARQVGKTCLLHLLKDEVERRGVPTDQIHYFDLEDLDILEIFNAGPGEVVGFLKARGANLDTRHHVFVDEIQYVNNPSNLLKLLADHHRNLKLIVSGSSTLEIRQKFKDSLAGRKVVFEVYPLDFEEFLIFRKEEKLAQILSQCGLRNPGPAADPGEWPARFFSKEFSGSFHEYLIYGGYPRVVLESSNERKAACLSEIYNSYVRKDVKDLMRVGNVTAFNNLLKALALQVGSLVNLHELCNTVRIARETLERYLFLLENTFIIRPVTPFSRNPRKEISKMAKIYFADTGLRNIIIKNLNPLDQRVDAGALVENGVLSNILKNLGMLDEIHFWRTLAKNEVDFVLIRGTTIRPVEVKYATFKAPRIPTGIRNFRREYSAENGVVLTRDYFGIKEGVTFLPAWLS